MACCHSGNFLLTVPMSFQEVLSVAMKIENTVQLVFGLGFHASA